MILEIVRIAVLVLEAALGGFIFALLVPRDAIAESYRKVAVKSVLVAVVTAVVVGLTCVFFGYTPLVAVIGQGPGFFGGMALGYAFGQRAVDFLFRLLVGACE